MCRAFGIPIGYSDHTMGIATPIAAATLGADLLEKHFTTARDGFGPDRFFRVLEPPELDTMVCYVREAQLALGTGRKRRTSEEETHLKRGRRSLFAARDIKAGERLRPDAVKIVRQARDWNHCCSTF